MEAYRRSRNLFESQVARCQQSEAARTLGGYIEGTRQGSENLGNERVESGVQSSRAPETSTKLARTASDGWPVKLAMVRTSPRSDGQQVYPDRSTWGQICLEQICLGQICLGQICLGQIYLGIDLPAGKRCAPSLGPRRG